MTALSDAVAEARLNGWATMAVSIDDVALEVSARGFQVVPTRRGADPVGVLRPLAAGDAHPRSLSRLHGVGVLPLHTDAAHTPMPPTITVLAASSPTSTSTLLFRATEGTVPPDIWQAMEHGIFAIRGREKCLVSARDVDGRVRFDAGCMRAQDPLSRSVGRWLATEGKDNATAYTWSGQQTLVIDNTRTLHGRADASGTPEREIRRIMVAWPE